MNTPLKLTVTQYAKELGVSTQVVSNWIIRRGELEGIKHIERVTDQGPRPFYLLHRDENAQLPKVKTKNRASLNHK